MKNLLFTILVVAVFSAIVGTTTTGCSKEKKTTDTLDTAAIKPVKLLQDSDTTAASQPQQQQVLSATGEVVDGSKDQVSIKISQDSIADFTYENLDHNDPKVFYHWSLDNNDRITVRYIKVKQNGMDIDSVVSIQKAN